MIEHLLHAGDGEAGSPSIARNPTGLYQLLCSPQQGSDPEAAVADDPAARSAHGVAAKHA